MSAAGENIRSMPTSLEMNNTCAHHWANDDPAYKGPHTCHLHPKHTLWEHECACGAFSADVLVA